MVQHHNAPRSLLILLLINQIPHHAVYHIGGDVSSGRFKVRFGDGKI